MNPWQLAGSLVAVLVTAGVVAWLGLGRGAALADPERLAEELLPGFDSAESFSDDAGKAALVRGRDGSWALIRLSGLHPVARRFAHMPKLEQAGPSTVRVVTGERRFGDTIIGNDNLLTLV